MTELLTPGTQAPDFTLKSGDGDEVTLSDLRGQKVVLAFYPLDWSPGCQNQMDAFSAGWDQVSGTGARVFGISVDSHWSHKAWREARDLKIPLLSDFHPKGAVGQAYGVYNPERGNHRRVTYYIDEQGGITEVDDKPATDASGVEAVCSILDRM
ncbi:MAG TPA: peroxiredoxin [Thermomicrobiales bacterium]|nr:peroxiredoxin [Thermomicrobiales bacterium]